MCKTNNNNNNNLSELRRQKELQLDEMKDSYQSREEIDTSVLATINSAECTMNLLEDRFLSLQVKFSIN